MKTFTDIIKIAVVAILFSGCAKDNTEPEPDPLNPVNLGNFSWQPSTGSTVNADSSYYYLQINTIYAFKNGNLNSVEIVLSSLTVGTYSVSSVTGNDFTFVSGATTYTAGSGSVSITSTSGNKLAGNFNVNFQGGSLTNLSGSFSDVPAR